MLIALPLVRRDIPPPCAPITKMLLAPFSERLRISRLPSGEKRGAKVMPGMLPIECAWPVSTLYRKTLGVRVA